MGEFGTKFHFKESDSAAILLMPKALFFVFIQIEIQFGWMEKDKNIFI